MKLGYNGDPQGAWRTGELDTEMADYVRREVEDTPHLASVLSEMAEDLSIGGSRTLLQLPINLVPRDVPDTMVGAARGIADEVWSRELNGIGEGLRLYTDESLDRISLNPDDLPRGAKASLHTTIPFGYVRVERAQDGLHASVGCFEPQTQTHYSLPL